MLRRILLLSFLIARTASAQDEGESWVYLQGEKDTVKLLWTPPGWHSEGSGFNVKRRVPGGAWKTLNRRPIDPTFFAKDMQTRTNDPAVLAELEKLQVRVEESKLRELLPLDEMLKRFAEREFFEDRIHLVRGAYGQALLFGFGYQDANVPKGDTYEYGLFMVARDGTQRADPLAVRSWKWGSVPSLKMRFGQPVLERSPGEHHMRVVWPMSVDELQPNLVRYLRVSCVGESGRKLGLARLFESEIRARKAAIVELKGVVDSGVLSIYAVPVNYFDFEGTPSPAVSYEWEKYREELLTPGPVA